MSRLDNAVGALDNLKSRLGFGRNDDDDFYDDGYDDYADYEDGGYSDDFDNRRDSAAVGGYRPATAGYSSHSSRFGRADSAASNLVSIDDVKARTQIPDRLHRDPLESDNARYDAAYTPQPDAGSSYPATYAPNSPAPSRDGVDSLFEPTDSPTFTPFDPYEAYSSASPSSYSSTRSLTVIKPVVYGDVERVARAVKSGDVVVLVMRNTPDDLSKRILDFSFGVASALDANVECPGDKVFAIAHGQGLTEDEKSRLRSQGAL